MPIDPLTALQTLAEISIAVVGFIGIVAVYQRVNNAQSELARWRVYTVLTFSLAALLFSLIPIGLSLLGITGDVLWQCCSGGLVVGYLFVYGDLIRSRRQLSTTSRLIIEAHPWYGWTLTLMSIILVTLLILNAAELLIETSPGVYYFGVVGAIVMACVIFGRTVFGPQANQNPDLRADA